MEGDKDIIIDDDYLVNGVSNVELQAEHEVEEEEPQKRSCRRFLRRMTVEPIILLYGIGLYPLTPVTQQYVYAQVAQSYNLSSDNGSESLTDCNMNTSSPEYQLRQQVQSEATLDMLIFHVSGMIPEFIMTLILGSYTDTGGRKKILLLPIVGNFLRVLITLFIIEFEWPVETIAVTSFIAGMFGGTQCLFTVCYAYLSDITNEKERSFRMFILDVVFNFSKTIGNLSIAYVIKDLGYFWAFLISGVFFTFSFAYAFFKVKETVDVSQSSKFLSLEHVKKSVLLYVRDDETKRRWKLQVALLIVAIACYAQTDVGDSYTYNLLIAPLCFTSVVVGFWISTSAGVRSVGGMMTVRFLNPKIGDLFTVLLGCVSGIAFPIGFAFITNRLGAFLVILLAICINPVVTMLRSFSSKTVTAQEQGAVSAGISYVQTLVGLLGLISSDYLYSATVDEYKPAVFFFQAAVYCVAFFTTGAFIAAVEKENQKLQTLKDYDEIQGRNQCC